MTGRCGDRGRPPGRREHRLTALSERPGPVPRAHLAGPARIALWALRVLVTVLTVLIAWTFVVDVGRGAALP